MTLDQQPPSTHWVIDKKIPIALVVTIVFAFLGQTIGVVTWVTNVANRVTSLEETRTATSASGQEGRIIRLETVVIGVQSTLSNIDRKLDRIIETRPSP